MLFNFNDYQGSVWFTQANALAGYLLQQEAELLKYVRMDEANRELMQKNLVLQYNNEVLRRQLSRLTRDSSFTERVQARLLEGIHSIPAHVINSSIRQKDN